MSFLDTLWAGGVFFTGKKMFPPDGVRRKVVIAFDDNHFDRIPPALRFPILPS
jgi:hypothetical protein